jgi:hypothetical protein
MVNFVRTNLIEVTLCQVKTLVFEPHPSGVIFQHSLLLFPLNNIRKPITNVNKQAPV